MKVTKQTKYIAYFPNQKAPYFDDPDSGGWYNFSYTPLCSGLKDSKKKLLRVMLLMYLVLFQYILLK